MPRNSAPKLDDYRAKRWDDHPDYSDSFGEQLKIPLRDIARDLQINYRLLAQWAQERRFRYYREATYPHKVWVPLGEIPKIAAIPRGKGRPGVKGEARQQATEERATALVRNAVLRDVEENPDR